MERPRLAVRSTWRPACAREADTRTDKSDPTAFELVKLKSGSGDVGMGTELLRKKLYDIDGDAIASEKTIVANAVSEDSES